MVLKAKILLILMGASLIMSSCSKERDQSMEDQSNEMEIEAGIVEEEEEKEQDEKSEIIGDLKLAVDEDKREEVDRIFDQYKDEELIVESPEFFQVLLFAYGKFNDRDRTEEVLEKIIDLGLKIDPEILINNYTRLDDLGLDALADRLIDDELYKKDIMDMDILNDLVNEEEEREYLNLTSGYFLSPDRLDLALVYGVGGPGYYDYYEIELINGSSGELLASIREESIASYIKIGSFDRDGNKDHLISLWEHSGGVYSPSTVSLYQYRDGEIQRLELEEVNDLEVSFKDNFEYEINSHSLDENYTLQLDPSYIAYYVSQRLYDQEGKLRLEDEIGFGEEFAYTVTKLTRPDHILYSQELLDYYEHGSFLANIKSYLEIQEDQLRLVRLEVLDIHGEPMPRDYREVEGYEEIDLSTIRFRNEELLETLDFYIELLDEEESSIEETYGEALDAGYYDLRFKSYDDFVIFLDDSQADKPVFAVWTRDILDIENDDNEILSRFGMPDDMGYDEMEEQHYMKYSLEDYFIKFVNIGHERPYIEIKKRP